MSTFSSKAAYRLSRIKNFMKTFTGKVMGVLGLIIIILFAVIALGAQFMTTYNPITSMGLASAQAAPAWLRHVPPYLGGNPELSENLRVVKDMDFNSPSSLQEWSTETNGTGFSVEYEPSFGFTTNGSARISYYREEYGPTGNYTFMFFKKFYFPYKGPPGGFTGRIAYFVDGSGFNKTVVKGVVNETTGQAEPISVTVKFFHAPVHVELFLGHEDDFNWTMWPIIGLTPKGMIGGVAAEYTGEWASSTKSGAIHQGVSELNTMFRALTNEDALTTVFRRQSLPANYFFGLRLTFLDYDANANQTVSTDFYVDDLGLDLPGSSWGLLGTDQHGRDLFTQLVYGSRLSLYVGLLSSFISVFLGLIVGLIAGYLGRVVDEILMRFTDMLLVVPSLPLLIIISAVLGTGLENLILIIGFLGWMSFARLVRSQVLSLKERPFIEAAKAAGAGRLHILTSHIMPNVASLIYVSLATAVPSAIVAEAALAFLGFTDPWRVSWGKMLADAQEASAWAHWWWVVPPGLCIALLSMAFIFLGYALDEVLNPKLRVRR